MKNRAFAVTLCAAATLPHAAFSQDCQPPGRGQCGTNDANTVVVMPVGANAETPGAAPRRGFAISVNGQPGTGDPRLADLQRRADIALAAADIQVRFDGLQAERRLDAQVIGPVPAAGGTVTFQSRLNYPAFVRRGEIRIIDMARPGGPRTLRRLAITPGGRASTEMPEGDALVYVHRVYGADGRFDETEALPLSRRDTRDLAGGAAQEEGSTSLARRDIRITGGAVTVSGRGLPGGARVRTMGEVVAADAHGRFVLQRILPVGDHAIGVAAQTVDLTREVEIPGAEWFHVGLVDITLGRRADGSRNSAGQDISGGYDLGRIAGYVRGRTASGVEVVASVDSGEEGLRDIFRNLDRRDPHSLLRRVDPDDLYPTYGDDSVLVETAPTSGRFYVRLAKDGNHILWGDYRAVLDGADYVRNDRTLYGAQGHWESPQVTPHGAARTRVDAYAALPDNLPVRDVFRGTGGSVYFLSKQDISLGSETLSVEIRDPQSDRVIDRATLVEGRDYDINYMQGVIVLNQPLTAYAGSGDLITSNPNGDDAVFLVAQYEWTPTGTDVDGYAYGGRAETWITDNLRVGASGLVDKTDTADHTVAGVDLRWQRSENTWVEMEYAASEGPLGTDGTVSTDGGLTGTATTAPGGSGSAWRLQAEADLPEIGVGMAGHVGGYLERRNAGFTSLDYAVTSDETLWGIYGELPANDVTRYRFYTDFYKNDAGRRNDEVGLELHRRLNDRTELSFGAEHLKQATPGDASETGSRTDLALRYTRILTDDLNWYAFAQGTAARSGGLAANNRAGLGGTLKLGEHWTLEGELSDGNTGPGARALASHDDGEGRSRYFGYTLDPDRSYASSALQGRDRGQIVLGGTRKVSDTTTSYAENTYDMFGQRRALTGAYGIDYRHSDYTGYSVALEVGDIEDDLEGDFRRHALSVGYAFDNEVNTARARVEYRRDRGQSGATNRDSDTITFVGTHSYRMSEDSRIVSSLDLVYTDAADVDLEDTKFAELSLGYAYRPVAHDRLNVLARYRFVYDEYGQVIHGSAGDETRGPLQHSHIFSVDAEYDVSPRWSLGGKLGFRLSETAPAGTRDFTANNAWLAVANARYHVTHNWDALIEWRTLRAVQADTVDQGLLVAVYRHLGNNLKLGIGYNAGSFSDDLADLTQDDRGAFINLVGKF